MTAERDAELAREQIGQTKLDHLHQRRNVSASATYANLLESKATKFFLAKLKLLKKLSDSGQEIRGEQDGSSNDALFRKIASLKEKGAQEHAAWIASLESGRWQWRRRQQHTPGVSKHEWQQLVRRRVRLQHRCTLWVLHCKRIVHS